MSKVINDTIVGRLENSDGYWEGEWNLTPNHQVRVIAEMDSEAHGLPTQFHQFLALVKTKDEDFRRAAAKSLIKLYNDTWNDTDKPISEDEFAKQIKLDSISFDEESDVNVYYDDADLFAGHSIRVVASYDGTVLKADLP